MSAHKKFIYFGTPSVSRETLAALLSAGYVPALVVTAPDARRGRGMKLLLSPTKELALEHGIEVFAPEKLDADALTRISTAGASYALVVAYGKILPESLIHAFPLGVLNVHYSLLPKYRGASPTEAALLAGDATTGVTIQKMVKELDAGDIVAQEETPIGATETARELRPRLIALGAGLLVRTLSAFEAGTLPATPQNHALATHCGKYRKEDGLLDLSGDALLNFRKYRAYADSIGTYFIGTAGERVKVRSARYENDAFVIERVVPEGKKEVAYADYARG